MEIFELFTTPILEVVFIKAEKSSVKIKQRRIPDYDES